MKPEVLQLRRKDEAAKKWLTFFNQVLLEKHLISEEDYRRMQREINCFAK